MSFAGMLFAADEQRVLLFSRAETAYARVEAAIAPELRDTAGCIQAQAALLPLAGLLELPQVRFRKGYCTLAGAVVTNGAVEYLDAALEFEKAIDAWPLRPVSKNKPAEPMPSALRILAAIARLQAGAGGTSADGARQEIAAAVSAPACVTRIMPQDFCEAMHRTGRQWLGWMALRRDDLVESERYLADAPATGWAHWTAGRRYFQRAEYREAAARYRRAVELLHSERPVPLAERLHPPADRPAELTELGGAQLLAGDATAAIATLDAVVKLDSSNTRARFLRALAKERAGQREAALSDYNLASRTAFANAHDLASGEAHLYRGILLFRRRDFTQSENEFASALNFLISGPLRADAVAWRHFAAVAGGACEASRIHLERSLAAVTPYFPKEEARMLAVQCTSTPPAAALAAPSVR
jgi:tetratricopeptide (TPR) repeat protein